jgi:predicted aspartyl protease
MYHLEFTAAHSYGSEREGIVVPVLLKSGANSVRLAASVDTGATFCLFRNELADALGLDLTSTASKRFRTASGSFEAFAHDVEITVLGMTTFSTIYFFADASINKNVLGRVGWLDRFRDDVE